MHIDTRIKKFPLVTLLIPLFDSAAYVADAINAALSQTYGHIEIIIAPDDGDTYHHLRKTFTSTQLRIIPPGGKTRTGAGPTRNRAIDASRGDYLTMLDADDLVPPDYVEELMRVAIVEGAAIAPIRYTRWDTNDVLRAPPVHKRHLSLSGFANLLASMHPLLHRSLEHGYCSGFAEDVVHDGIAIARLGTIQVVDTVAYINRLRNGSECNRGRNIEREIQDGYRYRIEQILRRPTELGMQVLRREDRKDFADLFRFRNYASVAFANSEGNCYNTWVAGKEAALWDAFRATRAKVAFMT